jgi:hypothetical protein
MASGVSRRGAILERLLPYINRGNYFEWEGVIVFGSSSLSELIERLTGEPSEEDDPEFWGKIRSALHEIQVNLGRHLVAERASLGGSSGPAPSKSIEQMTPEELQRLITIFNKLEPLYKDADESKVKSDPASVEEFIDAALAEEFLGNLSEAVDRAVRLDLIDIERVPAVDIRRYFDEAHRCYLYGFKVACAVLCRAILESALISVCDPSGTIRNRTEKGESLFRRLVKNAEDGGLLVDDEPQCALDVRDGGNYAIHNYPKFEERWGSRVEELLYKTRAVLLGLYGVKEEQ